MKSLIYAIRPLASDMLSTIVFAALFAALNNVVLATALAMAVGAGQVLYDVVRRQPIPRMQWASLGLVTVLGGATLITGDPRFVMIKPTIIYLTIGAAMLEKGWLNRYIPPEGRPYMSDGVLTGWGYAWAGLMFFTAIANAVIAVALPHALWVQFIAIFPLVSKIALFAVQFTLLRAMAIRNARSAGVAA